MGHQTDTDQTDTEQEFEISPHLARLWRLSAPERRGRPARLTLDRVVSHAVELADAGGLKAVTIPRVAKAAGCSTMALYRHVSSKDELLVLMTDMAAGAPPDDATTGTTGSWRDGLRAWAEALYTVVSNHPWIPHVPIGGPPSGPGHMAWLDAALRTLRGATLHDGEKVAVVTVVAGYVHQAVRLATDHTAAMGDDPAEGYRSHGAALAELVRPSRFPDAAEIFAAGSGSIAPTPVGDYHFSFGLDLLLDGIERLSVKSDARGRSCPMQ